MKSETPILIAALAAGLAAGTGHAAYTFQIDEFAVWKNLDPAAINTPADLLLTPPIFHDRFDNGRVPPDDNSDCTNPALCLYFSNGSLANYGIVTGSTVGPEAGGKLTLDSGGAMPNNLGTLRQQVTLLSNNSNAAPPDASASLGLKAWNNNFVVGGIFDFANPGNGPGAYGVRFTDNDNDQVSLVVRGREDGRAVASFQRGTSTTPAVVLDTMLLETGHAQIALALAYGDADGDSSKEVGAAFFYLDGVNYSPFHVFNTYTHIFDGENWTRAAFVAIDSGPLPIPEPATYALMLAGLGLVGWRVGRRT